MYDIGKVGRVQLVTAPVLGAPSRICMAIEVRVGPQTADVGVGQRLRDWFLR